MKQLTKIDIINETVEFYSNNPRSIQFNEISQRYICMYNGENNTKCAFSRCCTNDSQFKEFTNANNQYNAVLLPQYAHFPLKDGDFFWDNLQSIHDKEIYWNGNKLTTEGKEFVNELLEKYA